MLLRVGGKFFSKAALSWWRAGRHCIIAVPLVLVGDLWTTSHRCELWDVRMLYTLPHRCMFRGEVMLYLVQ